MFADTALTPVSSRSIRRTIDWEFVAEGALLTVVLLIGLATAADYGTTVDEFNTEPYGHQAIAWYLSGFTDRALFNNAEVIHLYGPWFHMITAAVQQWSVLDPLTVRHTLTFVTGLLGIAALGPIGRLVVGRWAGLVAILLCLATGYVYGHLFFSPIDVPFLAAMTWATLAIIVTTRRVIPCWRGIVATGLMLGLALGTRPGGVIAQAYFFGAMMLCAFAAIATRPADSLRPLMRITLRLVVGIAIAWGFAIACWPWLQVGNPLVQFWTAFTFFTHMDIPFNFLHWGKEISTAALPWHYIPGQFLARLSEPFLVLLMLAMVTGLTVAFRFSLATLRHVAARGVAGLRAPLSVLARYRAALVVAVAAFAPIMLVLALDSTIYDGVRHIMFVIPMLAVVASWGATRMLPVLRKAPTVAAAAVVVWLCASVATLAALHPLQYIAINQFAGGNSGDRAFELDYWSAAATTAVRQLEDRLDRTAPRHYPKVMVCIGWREQMAAPLLPHGWRLVTSQDEADFLIETERSPCSAGTNAVLIDEVMRAGQSLARTYLVGDPQRWLRTAR